MWQFINKEAGNVPSYNKKKKIELRTETGTITNLQKVTEMLNSYSAEIVYE
jgi:hypothetical protein